jgi:hypothetical protein
VRHHLFFAGHRIFRAVAAGVVLVAAAAAGLPVMASPLAGSGPRVALAASVMNLLSIRAPPAGSNPVTYSLPNLKSAALYDDFEGHIVIALGLDHAAAYTVTANGNEVTVDVAH